MLEKQLVIEKRSCIGNSYTFNLKINKNGFYVECLWDGAYDNAPLAILDFNAKESKEIYQEMKRFFEEK